MNLAKKILVGFSTSALVLGSLALPVAAETLPSIDFEAPAYSLGNINGQNGWSKTGSYDVEVADVSGFANASGFGFGSQALRLSTAVTSGAFGDQTFTPGLTEVAGEAEANTHFEASFDIGSTQSVQQPGLFLSVSPDDGNGSRMSYAGFDDQADGIHVIFYDVTDPGPPGTVASFNGTDVATIDRTSSHNIKFVIDFVPGPANDVVELYVDGTLVITGTTWEDYYRYDPEQNGNGNQIFPVSKLIFREGGSAAPGTAGNGYLVDNVSLSSSASSTSPQTKDECKNGGWQTFTNPSFKNQGQCIKYVNHLNHGHDEFEEHGDSEHEGKHDGHDNRNGDWHENNRGGKHDD